MSYLANPQNHSQAQAIDEAKKGLMHFSECQDEDVNPDREFYSTREEAEKSASEKSGYDADSDMEYTYEARSMWLDEDGDLIIADDEDETDAAVTKPINNMSKPMSKSQLEAIAWECEESIPELKTRRNDAAK